VAKGLSPQCSIEIISAGFVSVVKGSGHACRRSASSFRWAPRRVWLGCPRGPWRTGFDAGRM